MPRVSGLGGQAGGQAVSEPPFGLGLHRLQPANRRPQLKEALPRSRTPTSPCPMHPPLPHCTAGVYRVHCSLNINTETGRLSARRPNLQNQPALEKDRYKVGGWAGGCCWWWWLACRALSAGGCAAS